MSDRTPAPPPSDADRPDGPGHGEKAAPPTCELCGGAMLDRHCKLVCLNCGYQRDCSDP